MKKIITLFLFLISGLAIAQAPNKMSYQAVIRDASNNLLASTTIGTKVSILQGSSTGTVVYSETHTTSTNTNGLVTLEIGAGTVVSGAFSSIDWSTGNYYIKTETDPTGGTNYTISGTSQLLSVPYAMYASSSGSTSNGTLRYVGNSYLAQSSGVGSTGTSEGTTSNLSLIAIGDGTLNANTTGQYNIGIGLGTLNLNTIGKNNNAIGYKSLNKNTTGSYNNAFGYNVLTENTTGDSNNAFGDGAMESNTTGGDNSAFGDFTLRKNIDGGDNSAFGESALENNTSGDSNSAFGLNALKANTTGVFNVAMGSQSLQQNNTGNNNTAIGQRAGYNSIGNGNVFLGYLAGFYETGNDKLYISNSNTTTPLIGGDFATKTVTINENLETSKLKISNGATNGYVLQSDASGNASWVDPTSLNTGAVKYVGSSYLGQTSGAGATGTSEGTTSNNELIAIGNDALLNNTTGKNNLAIGGYSLESNTTGEYNIGLGQSALNTNTSGTNNVAIGKWAGQNNVTGSSNTFIGDLADTSINNLTNATAIGANTVVSASNSLILGNNANVGIGTSSPTNNLDVQNTSTVNANFQSTTGGAYLTTSAPSTQEASLNFKTYNGGSNVKRWAFGKSTSSETGSNNGSDFFINRYDDSGNYNGQPLSISRANGTVTIGNNAPSTTENTLKINGSVATAVTTKSSNYTFTGTDYCVIFTGTSASTFTLPSASSCTGRIYLIVNQGSVALTTSTYRTAIATTATSIAVGASVQIISDGTEWRKIN